MLDSAGRRILARSLQPTAMEPACTCVCVRFFRCVTAFSPVFVLVARLKAERILTFLPRSDGRTKLTADKHNHENRGEVARENRVAHGGVFASSVSRGQGKSLSSVRSHQSSCQCVRVLGGFLLSQQRYGLPSDSCADGSACAPMQSTCPPLPVIRSALDKGESSR